MIELEMLDERCQKRKFRISESFIEFAEKAKAHGLVAVQCSPDHIQITEGKFLVNYYPNAKKGPKIYVDRMNYGILGGDDEAIKCASELPAGVEKETRKGQTHYKRAKRALLKKTNICALCNLPVLSQDASIDHIVPLALGGLNNRNNYQLAHKACNEKKGQDV